MEEQSNNIEVGGRRRLPYEAVLPVRLISRVASSAFERRTLRCR